VDDQTAEAGAGAEADLDAEADAETDTGDEADTDEVAEDGAEVKPADAAGPGLTDDDEPDDRA
jgi:hypothetical protein